MKFFRHLSNEKKYSSDYSMGSSWDFFRNYSGFQKFIWRFLQAFPGRFPRNVLKKSFKKHSSIHKYNFSRDNFSKSSRDSFGNSTSIETSQKIVLENLAWIASKNYPLITPEIFQGFFEFLSKRFLKEFLELFILKIHGCCFRNYSSDSFKTSSRKSLTNLARDYYWDFSKNFLRNSSWDLLRKSIDFFLEFRKDFSRYLFH